MAGSEAALWRALRHAQMTAYSQAALTGAALHGGRRLPRFERVFPDPRGRARAESGEQTLAAMRAWSRVTEVMAVPVATGQDGGD